MNGLKINGLVPTYGCLCVPNFKAMSPVTSGLGPENYFKKFGVKSSLIQKRLKYSKKYFTWLYVVRYFFIPTYTVSGIEFFFLFSFFAF